MKLHRRLLSATAALVFLSVLAPASPAYAQEPAGATQAHGDAHVEEARKHAKTGLEFYDDGNFEAARIELEKAYKIAPSFKLLYNIGLCYRQLNNYVEAVRALTRYLAEGGDQVPPDRKTEVQKVITEIQPRTASVEVSVDAPGASVMIDDEPVGTAPLSTPVVVNPGRRKVSATMPGRQSQAKVITLGASDTMKVELLLPLLPTAKEEKADPKKLGLYISLAATGVFAVATGVTGLLALKAKSDLDANPPLPTSTDGAAARAEINNTAEDRHSANNRLKTFSLISDITLGATVLAAGASVYFFIKSRPSKEQQAEAPKAARLPTNWNVGVGPGTLMLGSQF